MKWRIFIKWKNLRKRFFAPQPLLLRSEWRKDSETAKKNTSLRGGANADEVISWNINYISRDCFATRQLSLTLAMTYSNLLTIFSLRAVPSLIFQFFKITFFKTKNFLSRRERCFLGAAKRLSSHAAKKFPLQWRGLGWGSTCSGLSNI